MANKASKPISNGVNPITFASGRSVVGTGYIILDRNISRQEFIDNCEATGTVAIITEQREVITNCLITKEAWNNITFPDTYNGRGSAVLWVNIPLYNRVIIISNLSKRDEAVKNKSNQTIIGRRDGVGLAETTYDGNAGKIVTNVASQEDGGVEYNVLSSEQQSLYKIYVQGDYYLEADDQINIKSLNGFSLTVANPSVSGEDKQNIIEIDNEKILIKDINGNVISLDSESLKIVDKNNNSYSSDKDDIEITFGKDGSKITLNQETGEVNSKNINLFDKDISKISNNINSAILFEEFKTFFEDVFNKLSTVCADISEAVLTTPSGPGSLDPISIAKFKEHQLYMSTIIQQIDKLKSKTVKLT